MLQINSGGLLLVGLENHEKNRPGIFVFWYND